LDSRLGIPTVRAATRLIWKAAIAKISIQAHLLHFLRRKYFNTADTVHKLPEIPITNNKIPNLAITKIQGFTILSKFKHIDPILSATKVNESYGTLWLASQQDYAHAKRQTNEKRETVGLTPKGHLPPVEHHSRDLHRQVSNLSFADPPAVPLFQICELDPV